MTVLPQGNWSTVHKRWQRWSLASGRGVGRLLEQRCGSGSSGDMGSLQQSMSEADTVLLVLCKDALLMNSNLVCEEEQYMAQVRRAANAAGGSKFMNILSMTCVSHQCCLCCKPFVMAEKGLATTLTRTSHLLESGRNRDKLLSALDTVVQKNFVFSRGPGSSRRVGTVEVGSEPSYGGQPRGEGHRRYGH